MRSQRLYRLACSQVVRLSRRGADAPFRRSDQPTIPSSEETPMASESSKTENDEHPTRREQLFEVSVFLFLIVPSLVLSFFAIKQGAVSFDFTAVATTVRDLALVSLILFFLWRNREPVRRLGWTLENAGKEVVIGAVLFVPVFFGTSYLDALLQSLGFSAPATPQPSFLTATGPAELTLAFVLVVVVAVSEETMFRGYLMLRFEALSRSPALAILLSAFIFSLGHGYEGTSGAITVGAMGAMLAVVYLWRQSLVAPITIHFLQDFVGIVLVPLLGTH
jgi:membrane protease YdiL (CAAX protease family)